MLSLASVALAVLATARPVTDTTITVHSGTRLAIESYAGAIEIDTWNRSEVRIRAELSRRAALDIDHDAGRLALSASGKWGEPVWVDFQITVPHETPVEVEGIDTDIVLRGRLGAVKAETVKGDVSCRGTEGEVSVASVEGEVEVVGGGGQIHASSVNEGVRVVGVSGELQAESVNGDVFLEDLKAQEVEASTINGTIYYLGEIRKGGSYEFASHQGDLVIGMSEDSDVSGSVSTYNGSFSSSFAISTSSRRKDKEFNFTIGSGSARVSLESFNGSITIERPEEVVKRIATMRERTAARERARAAERAAERAVHDKTHQKKTDGKYKYDFKYEEKKHEKDADKDKDEDEGDDGEER